MSEDEEEKKEEPRRAAPRARCKWPVKCVTEQKKTFEAKAINISQGGIQLASNFAIKKGSQLYLEISGFVQGVNKVIKVVGKVAYTGVSATDGMQLGLQFTSKLSVDDNKFILAYVKSILN